MSPDEIKALQDKARGVARHLSRQREMEIRHRCFMDGVDWQHHLSGDCTGTLLFPDEESLRDVKTCLSGGCGVVEVEVRLIRWVEPQDLKYEATPLPNGDRGA